MDQKIRDVCTVYAEAPARAEQGERTVSTDELTGVQALERKYSDLPLACGKVARREFEYIRHGTRSFIVSRDVVSGQVLVPWGGPTRTEADFLAHVQAVVASDPTAARWRFVVDNLNIHQSESLVRWVATESDLDLEWSGGVARNASIIFVYAGLTAGDTCTKRNGKNVWDALDYAVQNNVAPLISSSYGFCESGVGKAFADQVRG